MMNSKHLTYTVAIAFLLLLTACKKDKVPVVHPVQPTKWEQISGSYKVYDTLGVYLYDMSIDHFSGLDTNGQIKDSLHFVNFDGEFDLKAGQSNAVIANWPRNYFHLDSYTAIRDNANDRWDLMGLTNSIYNSLVNDTIKLRFGRNNIHYYIEDVRSYFDCTCYQIAVKQ
jgi:hypothetical protein